MISDACATDTPVLALGEHYELKDGENCLVVRTKEEFVAAATRLHDDQRIWERIAEGKLTAIRGHSITRVAERLREEIIKVRPNTGKESLPPMVVEREKESLPENTDASGVEQGKEESRIKKEEFVFSPSVVLSFFLLHFSFLILSLLSIRATPQELPLSPRALPAAPESHPGRSGS
jgi:hypothetical protein